MSSLDRQDGRLKIELDLTGNAPSASGISAYSIALALELDAAVDVQLVLRTRRDGADPRLDGIPTRPFRAWDRLYCKRGWVRLVPHQMRPPVVFGRTVITIHDVIHLGAWTPTPKRVAFRVLLRLFRRSNVRVIAVSHTTRARLIAEGLKPDHVAVCQSRLPAPVPREGPQERPCSGGGFVYVGNLRPHKDVDTLVTAHAKLTEDACSRQPLHLITSDEGHKIEALQDLHAKLGGRGLCVHHRASDAERDWLIASSDAVVAPSFEEGYGFALDEAHLAGRPIFASAIPAHMENGIGRNVSFFEPGDRRALLDLLRSCPLDHAGTPEARGFLLPRKDIDQVLADLLTDR